MTANTRLLLPELPPELRNEVYAYLSDTTSLATNVGLPLQLKTFSCKHTAVQICPVHHGSASLLALQKYHFQEACEYNSWLLSNALELRIGVHFKGRVNTFVQSDWNKKMEAHLRKLAKLHPWLKKVSKYDIQILWDSTDGVLKSKNNKRIAGQIPMAMVKTLTQLMEKDFKRKRGDVNVGLHLDHGYAVGNAMSLTKFGLGHFFSETASEIHGFSRKLTKDAKKSPYFNTLPPVSDWPLIAIPAVNGEERRLLEVEKGGVVSWADSTRGLLVMRKTDGVVVDAYPNFDNWPMHDGVAHSAQTTLEALVEYIDGLNSEVIQFVVKELVSKRGDYQDLSSRINVHYKRLKQDHTTSEVMKKVKDNAVKKTQGYREQIKILGKKVTSLGGTLDDVKIMLVNNRKRGIDEVETEDNSKP
ncbi:hypothetical protein EJ02DRAFT_427428 [Clathrospora elynae]|uniref:Uncharacterized protein n=1 Tax=Clathrospora elynae TaxID=706981 RepID=A0A6A5S9H7_9PLEO|nr:hypothetical protein EJ02DRAFT_427428 [Clathrospora elynae]